MMNKLLIIFFICILTNLSADQKEIKVPVELEVDSYLHLTVDSYAENISPEGEFSEKVLINSGALDLGVPFEKDKQSLSEFSTNKSTYSIVKIISNSKPYKLNIQLFSDKEKTVLDLKNTKGECAFSIMLKENSDTKKSHYIAKEVSKWHGFSNTGLETIYNSHGEILSESFDIIFAVRDLNLITATAGSYGGKILWTLSATL